MDGPTYGVDASTTRPLDYNNGLIVDTAYAKTAVSGETADRAIEHTGRVVGVAYFDDDETTLHGKMIEADHVTAELIHFPETTDEPRNLSKSVATVAQRWSESQQAVDTLDDVDGPLFLDGSVLPLGIVLQCLREEKAIEAKGSSGSSGGTKQVVFDVGSGQMTTASADGGGGSPSADRTETGGADSAVASGTASAEASTTGDDPDPITAEFGEDAAAVLDELSGVDIAETSPIELRSAVQEWRECLDD